MFDHVGFNVSDFARSKALYLAALRPLGMGLMRETDKFAVIGQASGRLWIGVFGPAATPIHFAFRADNRKAVEAFHAAAIAAGRGATTAVRASARTTARITTPPSFTIPTGTTLRR